MFIYGFILGTIATTFIITLIYNIYMDKTEVRSRKLKIIKNVTEDCFDNCSLSDREGLK